LAGEEFVGAGKWSQKLFQASRGMLCIYIVAIVVKVKISRCNHAGNYKA